MGRVDSGRAWSGGHCPIFVGADAQDIVLSTALVGAWLAREAFGDLKGRFAAVRRPDKPCSYSKVLNTDVAYDITL